MPLEIEIQTENRLVITRCTDRVSDEDMLVADVQFRSNPAWKPEYDQLIDLSGATGGDVTSATVQTLTSRPPAFSAQSRRAIVAPGDLAFGMARMFEQMRAGEAGEIRIFRSLEDAEAWLREGSR